MSLRVLAAKPNCQGFVFLSRASEHYRGGLSFGEGTNILLAASSMGVTEVLNPHFQFDV